ncbi:bifunctional 2-polyprenyl-6-hydroxyphenol methylase/3-demethylubiquinol 3-O-methyltransferase UbiG [Nitrosovibrio sp. Nv6]|uniref:class I SAM-dependent methyltransferase n=1 Tax=Nitrosovibrio sp. Nv6 TaxID=1855340 RepID=UPI0008C0DA2E|nr:class I SAM-dependent methyltransferase [Nitrosovibrio sp. Nv6]SEP23966.1 Methyltransferase domain-containing protein [Nitrosovibrio sp. Nv6]
MNMNYVELEQISKESEVKLYQAIQKMTLEDLGILLLDPLEHYPSLKASLPSMPADEIQVAWTGNSGKALMKQSIAFIRTVAEFYGQNIDSSLQSSKILDYGCGWGRLIRLLYKYSLPENIYGCDAWERSLNLCTDSHVRGNLKICDEIPKRVPYDGVKFDFIYAFSVFTHLSERTSLAVTSALRDVISAQGLLAVTTRPIEYWDAHDQKQNLVDIEKMKNEHRLGGFAFTPHVRPPIDGEVTYGDTSISCDYISKHWNSWEVVGERSYSADPFQRIVFLKPV